ncbi:MAG: hypothetical protein MJ007_01735 [Paludibacteraceae bacterium]|nr:hypothetical protein [Paludibacteraceae bacterium]
MAEKKRIEWCRYYKGDESYDKNESKISRYYDYFWQGECNYVEGNISESTIDRLIEVGLGEYDPRLPQELLAALFGCVLHLYGVDNLDFCADIFVREFFPSYIKRPL